jgi:DNA-binding response OmpR family regulator
VSGWVATGKSDKLPPTRAPNIWIVEDDPGCQFLYSEVLGNKYQLTIFSRVAELKHQLGASDQDHQPSALIADINLPDGSIKDMLSTGQLPLPVGLPLIVVSSLAHEDDLRTCFQFGACDYLVKPFHQSELVVKLERCLTRGGADRICDLDPLTMTLSRSGKISSVLTSREAQIVSVLLAAGGRTVARSDLLRKVWGNIVVSPKTLDVHLFNLRRKAESIGVEIEFLPPGSFMLRVM